jgi:hypothetical protein
VSGGKSSLLTEEPVCAEAHDELLRGRVVDSFNLGLRLRVVKRTEIYFHDCERERYSARIDNIFTVF